MDDLDRIPAPAQAAVLRRLAGLPDAVQLSLASRQRQLTRKALWLLRRTVVERDAADLALAPVETARVLRDEHGVEDAEVADTVHRLTAGWPALVHLAGDALSRQGAVASELPAALSDPETAGATRMQDQVLVVACAAYQVVSRGRHPA